MDKWDKRFMEMTETIGTWSSCYHTHPSAINIKKRSGIGEKTEIKPKPHARWRAYSDRYVYRIYRSYSNRVNHADWHRAHSEI